MDFMANTSFSSGGNISHKNLDQSKALHSFVKKTAHIWRGYILDS